MATKGLRQRCEARLRDIALPAPFDISAFCESLEEQRGGRTIALHPLAGLVGICGLWIATDGTDFIFYDANTAPLHKEHIILHEIGHILCDHYAAPATGGELSRLLFPDLDPETVQRVLARTTYSNEAEQEAELLASLILQRVSREQTPLTRAVAPEVASLLDRFDAVLGRHHPGPGRRA